MASEVGNVDADSPMDANVTPVVHRRLDRSLENRAKYENMSPEDRNLIGDLRSSVESCKKKVESLRDELERSEYECEKNERLRHAAEERLRRHLVSMYASPNVDEELRERLPRANKSCPQFTMASSSQQMSCEPDQNSGDLSEGFLSYHGDMGKVSSARCSLDFNSTSPRDFLSMENDSQNNAAFPHDVSPPHDSCLPFVAVTSPIDDLLGRTTPIPKNTPAMRQFVHSTPLDQPIKPKISYPVTSPESAGSVEIQLLKDKVASLMDANKKLTEKLVAGGCDADHHTIILDKICEIYDAQKRQDEAVMSRIRQAYEERDEVLHHLKQIQDANLRVNQQDAPNGGASHIDEDDMDLSPGAIEEKGIQWAEQIEDYRNRVQNVAKEQLNAVIIERDKAIEKCEELEKRLVQLERQHNSYSLASTTQQTLQNKLEIFRKERDYALMKAHKVEEELQNFKIYYSLHRSLSKGENQSSDDYSTTEATQPAQPRETHPLMEGLEQDKHELVLEVARLADENSRMSSELNDVKVAYEELKGTKKKLETLVTVLRRKLKNSSQGT